MWSLNSPLRPEYVNVKDKEGKIEAYCERAFGYKPHIVPNPLDKVRVKELCQQKYAGLNCLKKEPNAALSQAGVESFEAYRKKHCLPTSGNFLKLNDEFYHHVTTVLTPRVLHMFTLYKVIPGRATVRLAFEPDGDLPRILTWLKLLGGLFRFRLRP